MGSAPSKIEGKYLVDDMNLREVKNMCRANGVKKAVIEEDVIPLFLASCRTANGTQNKLTRMQLLWGRHLFHEDGTPGQQLIQIRGAKQAAARAEQAAFEFTLSAAVDAASSAQLAIAVRKSKRLRRFQKYGAGLKAELFTSSCIVKSENRKVAERGVRITVAQVRSAMRDLRKTLQSESWKTRMAQLWADWRITMYHELQAQVDDEVGESCPCVRVHMINGKVSIQSHTRK